MYTYTNQLQWGRDLSIAEIELASNYIVEAVKLQWGRDLSIAEMQFSHILLVPRRRFNGAAIFRSRKSAQIQKQFSITYKLQWGRDLSIAEILLCLGRLAFALIASMGPRSFDRGNGGIGVGAYLLIKLQWGRDLSIAEIWPRLSWLRNMPELQWGRDLSIAEIMQAWSHPLWHRRFNGAAIFRSRKCVKAL